MQDVLYMKPWQFDKLLHKLSLPYSRDVLKDERRTIALHILAGGDVYTKIRISFGRSKGTVSKCLKQVVEAIVQGENSLYSRYVKMPLL